MLANLPDFTEKLRDKLRGSIAELLPDDALDALIKRETDLFLREQDGAFGSRQPSGLTKIIREELDTIMRAKVREWLSTNVERVWNGGAYEIVSAAATRMAPDVANALAEGVAKKALDGIRVYGGT